MNRIMRLLCAAAAGLSGFVAAAPAEFTVYAEEEYVYQEMRYIIDDGFAVITGYTAALPDDLTIPATIDNIQVFQIEDDAFQGCSCLKRVTVPDSVHFIGRAFQNCSNLECVVLL